jgi:hypothetical protein
MSTSLLPLGYELTVESRPEYLYAYVKGEEDSVSIDRRYLSEVASQCRARRCDKVLIEEDLRTQLSMSEMFDVASWISKLGLQGVKIAFVDRHPDHRPGNLFGETVAVNRGVWVKVCDSVAQAEDYLLSGSA